MSGRRREGGPGHGERGPSFYQEALVAEALRAADKEAADQLGGVIGDLRRRVRQQLYRRPEDVRLLLRSAEALTRAAAAAHRINPVDQRRLMESVSTLVDELGRELLSAPQ